MPTRLWRLFQNSSLNLVVKSSSRLIMMCLLLKCKSCFHIFEACYKVSQIKWRRNATKYSIRHLRSISSFKWQRNLECSAATLFVTGYATSIVCLHYLISTLRWFDRDGVSDSIHSTVYVQMVTSTSANNIANLQGGPKHETTTRGHYVWLLTSSQCLNQFARYLANFNAILFWIQLLIDS